MGGALVAEGRLRLAARILKRRGPFVLDVELTAGPGVTVLFGPSGSGKSTFLACLSGLLTPDEGEVILGERILFRAGSQSLPPESRRIGYLPQDLLLFPHLSVAENLNFGFPASPTREEIRRREELIDRLHLGPLLGRLPGKVSGGEAQRAALARALLRFPDLLLMDEPLSSLDRVLRESALSDLLQLRRELPIPVLYVTHSASEVLALADRVILLKDGRLLRKGGAELAFDPGAGRTDAHDALNFLSGTVSGVDESRRSASVRWGEHTLKVGNPDLPVGSPITLAISPHDILVSRESPGITSARNLLRITLEELTQSDDHVLLRFGKKDPLFVSVTPEAREELRLETGLAVFLLFKSTALRKV